MKKRILCMLLTGAMVALAAGCSSDTASTGDGNDSSADASEDGKTYAFVPPSMISPYYKSVLDGAQATADELGVELVTVAPESESDYAAQVQIIEDQITQDVDGLIVCAINSDAVISAIQKANEADIPVVMFNTQTELEGVDVSCYVKYDQYEAGGKVADFMAENIGTELQVAIVEGLPSDVSTQRMSGFVDKCEAEYPDIKVVANQAGDWEREKGMNAAANMLQANPDIDVIFTLSDEMGLGAVQAVKEAGSDAKVCSFDGNPNAVYSIQQGELFSTVYIGGTETGEKCVTALNDILGGTGTDSTIMVETAVVYSENAADYPAEAD